MGTDAYKSWGWATFFLVILGCDNDTTPEHNPCDDPSQLVIRAPDGIDGDPEQVAAVTVDELISFNDTICADESDNDTDGAIDCEDDDCAACASCGGGQPWCPGEAYASGLFSAVFADVSNLVEDTTPVLAFGPSCVARVGDPDPSEGLVVMDVEEVVFSSSVLGTQSLVPDDEGRVAPLEMPNVFSDSGGEIVSISVASSDGEIAFPDFTTELVVPPSINVVNIAEETDTSLLVEWVPSEASFMEIRLRTEPLNTTLPPNRIRCFFLEDDGCFVVPAIAMEWLTSQGVYDVSVRIERHSFDFVVASEIALAEIDAMRSIEFDINVE